MYTRELTHLITGVINGKEVKREFTEEEVELLTTELRHLSVEIIVYDICNVFDKVLKGNTTLPSGVNLVQIVKDYLEYNKELIM